MTVRQLAEASCTLACFESFLGQNGIRITQREMKKMRPDICGEVDDEARCVYTHHYAAVGQAFGFTCSEITGPDVLFPCYPTSAILMGTDVFYTPTPHSLLWTYINKSNGVGFAMNPAAEHYFRFHVSTLNQYTYGLVNAPITRYAPPNSRVEVVEKENLTSGTLIWLQVRPDPAPPHLVPRLPLPRFGVVQLRNGGTLLQRFKGAVLFLGVPVFMDITYSKIGVVDPIIAPQ